MIHRFAAVPIGVGLLVIPAVSVPMFGADEKKVVKPPAVKVQAPRPAVARAAGQGKPAQQQAVTPRQQEIERLSNMSPEEQAKELHNLPLQRQENLKRALSEYRKIPTPERTRVGTQLEMLRSLPPQRQNQVKRSIKQFGEIPEERRQQMSQELTRMSRLTDEDRRAYMNTEEFRNRYSPTEQQIMGNISEVTPEIPPHD